MINPYEPTLSVEATPERAQSKRLAWVGSLYAYPSLALILFGILATDAKHFTVPILLTGFSFAVPLLLLPYSRLAGIAASLLLIAFLIVLPAGFVPDLQLTWADRLAGSLGLAAATAIAYELDYYRRFLLCVGTTLITILVCLLPTLALAWCLIGIFINHRAIGKLGG